LSRWFRHYAGMMRDDKLVRVAIRSKQTIERVVWIYGAILESAAEIDDDGRYDFDTAEAAYFLRADENDVAAIVAALDVAGRLSEGRVVRWGDRQFKSDRSAERQARYRERQRNGDSDGEQGRTPDNSDGHCNGEVTSLSRHGDAPETETETELDTEIEKTEAKASSKKRRTIPDDWQPIEFALGSESRKVTDSWPPGERPAQVEQFKAHHRSKRNTFVDPQDAWSTWVLNTRKWGIGKNERSNGPSTLDRLVAAGLRHGDGTGEDAQAGRPDFDDGSRSPIVARIGNGRA